MTFPDPSYCLPLSPHSYLGSRYLLNCDISEYGLFCVTFKLQVVPNFTPTHPKVGSDGYSTLQYLGNVYGYLSHICSF
jgi:hypothetical protein